MVPGAVPGAEPAAPSAGPAAASAPTRVEQGRAGPSILDRIHEAPVAVVGTLFVFVGAVLQLVAILSASWWHVTLKNRQVTFGFTEFGQRTQQGLAFIYFSWGAWALLLVSLALGIAACVRWRGARPFRIAGAIVGVAGAVVTIAALLTFAFQADEDIFQVARNYTSGVYLATLGLLATAFGAAAGGAGR